ncbi:MAG: lysophospholipid acyltransferase family protein [Myxococcota bacterium]|nr:lysophospholipid acyltransferase family protein [Myxococcota bacterium]
MIGLKSWARGRVLQGCEALSWGLAWTWWYLVPKRRDLAIENIALALPSRPPAPLLRQMMAGLILSFFESIFHSQNGLPDLIFEGLEPVRERVRAGKGTLLLAGHSGAWELMVAAASREQGLPLTLIARDIAWGPARELVAKNRVDAGIEVLPPEGSVFRVLSALSEGRVVVFLLDQRHNGGIPVTFFGRDAWTSRALALVAQRSRCPVYGVWSWRNGLARHHARVEKAFPLIGNLQRDTQQFMRFYEEAIRAHPESWLWLHDRWRKPGRGVA